MNASKLLLAGACFALAACASVPTTMTKVASATGPRTDVPAKDVAVSSKTLYSQSWGKDEDDKSKDAR